MNNIKQSPFLGLTGMGGGTTGLAVGGGLPKRTYIDEVFSNYRYKGVGNNSQTITNGIDIAGDGGMLIVKSMGSSSWNVMDTVQGANKYLKLNYNHAVATSPSDHALTSFNSNGFTLGDDYNTENQNGTQYGSWMFKKTKKFFDVVQYSGDSSSNKEIAHDLGSVPGMIWIKRTDDASSWCVYHKGLASSGYSNSWKGFLNLDSNGNNSVNANGFQTQPTSTHFYVNANYGVMNASGATYIAYLFGSDEEAFGPDGDQPIAKAGYFQLGQNGASSGETPFIDLGFNPSVLVVKKIDGDGDWYWYDERNFMPSWRDKWKLVVNGEDSSAGGNHPFENYNAVSTNSSSSEYTGRGFRVINGWALPGGAGSTKYVYFAFAASTGVNSTPPETATDVFTIDAGNGQSNLPIFDSGFPVDMAIVKNKSSAGSWGQIDLHKENYKLHLDSKSDNNGDWGSRTNFRWNKGHMYNFSSFNSNFISWMWKNSAGFESLTYKGIDANNSVLGHSLGSEPEMIWIKTINSGTYDWCAWSKYLDDGNDPYSKGLFLNTDSEQDTQPSQIRGTSKTTITLGNSARVNENDKWFTCLLFASVSGISKVGWYTGDGTSDGSKEIDLGFSPRFLIMKSINNAGDWYQFDTYRGFYESSNSVYLKLNTSGTQDWSTNTVRKTSTGFGLYSPSNQFNANGAKVLYYAHA